MSINKLPTAMPRDNLIGEWILDSNDGTNTLGTDTSGNGYDLTVTNVTPTSTNKGYQRYNGDFNGSSSYAESGINNNFKLSEGSLSTYIRVDTIPTTPADVIFNYQNNNKASQEGFKLIMRNSKLEFYFPDTGGSSLASVFFTPTVGVDYHVMATWDSSNIKLYINGVEEDSIAMITPSYATNQFVGLGAIYITSSRTNYYDGLIGATRLYDKALNATEREIDRYYHLRRLAQDRGNYPELYKDSTSMWDMQGDGQDIIGGLNGTLTGTTGTTDHLGNAGRAFTFSGTTAKIDIPDAISATAPYSYSVWFTAVTETSSGYQTLLALRYGTNTSYLAIRDSGTGADPDKVELGDWQAASASKIRSANVTGDGWHQAVAVINSTTSGTLYMDGAVVGTYTSYNFPSQTLGNNIGNFDGNSREWDGKIGQVILYDRALGADEIAARYQLEQAKYIYPYNKTLPANLRDGLTFWMNGDNSGTTWYDQSGNGDNGTGSGTVDPKRILTYGYADIAGTDDWINIDDALAPQASATVGTIAYWVKPDAGAVGTSQSHVWFGETANVSDYAAIGIYHLSINVLRFFGRTGTDGTTSVLLDTLANPFESGVWCHVVLVQDGVEPRFYINGKLAETATVTGTTQGMWFNDAPDIDNGRIGIRNSDGTPNSLDFAGGITQVKCWTRALTATEVQQDYYSTYIEEKI